MPPCKQLAMQLTFSTTAYQLHHTVIPIIMDGSAWGNCLINPCSDCDVTLTNVQQLLDSSLTTIMW